MSAITDLFNRLGKILGEIEDTWSFLDDVVASNQTINGQYDDADRNQIAALNGNLDADVALLTGYIDHLITAAQTTLIEETHAISPLKRKDVANGVEALRDQMLSLAETVKESTVGKGSPDYTAANGDGVLAASVTDDEANGDPQQNLRAETVLLECTLDAQAGGTLSGGEQFRVRGEAAVPRTDRRFPQGSGIDMLIRSAHAGIDRISGPGGNLGRNSSFHAFSTLNQPDYWIIDAGVPGTQILESADGFRGAKALEIARTDAGDPLSKMHQELGTLLKPDQVYCWGVWLKDGSTAPTGGELRVSVRDDADSGLPNSSLTIDLDAGLTSSWAAFTLYFRTPTELPAPPRILIEMTTGMAVDGESFLLSDLVLTEPWQDAARPGSPFFTMFAGATDWTKGDRITIAFTRTGGKLLKFLDAVWGLHELPYLLPEASSPTYDDTLVT